MMKNVLNISILSVLFALGAMYSGYAGEKVQGVEFRAEWGLGDEPTLCGGTGVDAGFDEAQEYDWYDWAWYLATNKVDDKAHGYATFYYVAREMTQNGYLFCKTAVAAERTGGCTKDPYPEYYEPIPESEGRDCFWLCKDGFYGDGCKSNAPISTSADVMAAHNVRAKSERLGSSGAYHKLESLKNKVTYENIEASIPMFHYDIKTKKCGGENKNLASTTKRPFHDTVLALKSVVTTENTVTYTAQPLTVRGGVYKGCYAYGDNMAWPMVYWVGNENKQLCPSGGFKMVNGVCTSLMSDVAVSEKDKAELATALSIAEQREKDGLDILCPGWDRNKYDNKVHEILHAEFVTERWRQSPLKISRSAITSLQNNIISTQTPEFKQTAVVAGGIGINEDVQLSSVSSSSSSTNAPSNGKYTAGCTVFACKNNLGYADDPTITGDYSCVDCSAQGDNTISAVRKGLSGDGVCLKCSVGEIFDSANKKCVQAKPLSTDALRYGGNEGVTTDIEDQCWTKGEPSEYKKCVLGE